jgi:Ca2+:H+ antiporter
VNELVDRARAEAARLGHDYVGSEHLFLALLDADDPSLGAVLTPFNLDPATVREGIERRIPKGKGATLALGDAGLRSGARRALDQAKADAAAEDAAPGGKHLLRALLRDGKGPIAGTLADLGAPVARVREALGGRPNRTPRDKPAEREAANSAVPPAPRPRREKKGTERKRDAPPSGESAVSGPTVPRVSPHIAKGGRRPAWLSGRNLLLLAVPASIAANSLFHENAAVVFVLACLGVLPLAGYMGEATEHLAARTGPTLGGFLNATFGNAAELIIAIVALRAGFIELVKASITGSILGNLLLILGLSLVAASSKKPLVQFNRTAAGMSAGMLALAVTGLVFPAILHSLHPGQGAMLRELHLSEGVAGILIVTYAFSLYFSLRTHSRVIAGEPHPTTGPVWGVGLAILVLALATVGIAIESEILVHATEIITRNYSFITEAFLGLIIIPIIGNAAEHATAILVARKGQTDLALQIALGSSTQVALLIGPLLVFIGLGIGPNAAGAFMNLVFTPLEVIAVGLATMLAAILTLDGESHWFEGIQLLALYGMIAVAVFFI